MKKRSLIILILTVSALTLSACNGCGSKKDAQTSEVPLIVLEDKNATQVADKPEVETSENDTSKGKEAKKDDNKKVPVVIEDKNTQTTTQTKPKTETTPKTQITTQAQTTPQTQTQTQTTTANNGWQTPAGQTSTPQTTPETPTVSTDNNTNNQSDDGTITLPLIPLN